MLPLRNRVSDRAHIDLVPTPTWNLCRARRLRSLNWFFFFLLYGSCSFAKTTPVQEPTGAVFIRATDPDAPAQKGRGCTYRSPGSRR